MFNRINESFDKKFKTLAEDSIIEQLEECLNKLNEATISDEDQRDSDLIRSMLDKMKARSNAKFTPEEKAVLDKYGITRNNDFKNLFVDDRPLDRNVDNKRNSYSFSKNHYSNGTRSKINYADRARKSRERDKTQVFPGWGRVKNDEINAHGGGMSTIDTLQDAHNIAQGTEMKDKIHTMKNHIWDRDFHKEYVDNADATYDKAVADAHAEYEKKLRDAKQSRNNAKTGWHKQGLDRAQGEIDKMLKRTPKTESKSIKGSDTFYIGWSKMDMDKFHDYMTSNPELKIYKRGSDYYVATSKDDTYAHQVDNSIVDTLKSDTRFKELFVESKSMNEAPIYDMSPRYDARQSFYGKARVDDNGNEKTLYSYNTPVAKIVGNKVELLPKWDWSQTTLRHVKEFLKQNGFEANSLAQMKRDYL